MERMGQSGAGNSWSVITAASAGQPHLRYVRMPGGDKSYREPWRMALAHLLDAEVDPAPLDNRIDRTALRLARTMLHRDLNSPRTSSVGRLFDAVASIAAVRDTVSHEAQAAMQMEWLGHRHGGGRKLSFRDPAGRQRQRTGDCRYAPADPRRRGRREARFARSPHRPPAAFHSGTNYS